MISNSSLRFQIAWLELQIEILQGRKLTAEPDPDPVPDPNEIMQEKELMALPDEILIRIYYFLDSKSLKQLMETCKKNYKLINFYVPPTYYLDEKKFLKYFDADTLQQRNFKNLKVTIAADTVKTFYRFFMRNGDLVRNLTARITCCSCQNCLKFFKLLPLIKKLHMIIDKARNGHLPYFQNPENSMLALSELTISTIDLKLCVDLKLFIKSRIKKITFRNGLVELSATNEEIENSNWSLSELTMEAFTISNNLEEIVKLIKKQKYLKFVHFRLRNRQNVLKGNSYGELVEFFLKTVKLNTLLCTVPRNWINIFTTSLKNSSIKYLELRNTTFSKEQKLSIEECFTHPNKRFVYEQPRKNCFFVA